MQGQSHFALQNKEVIYVLYRSGFRNIISKAYTYGGFG